MVSMMFGRLLLVFIFSICWVFVKVDIVESELSRWCVIICVGLCKVVRL